MLAVAALGQPARAQMAYTVGADPVIGGVQSTSQIVSSRQSSTADLEAIVTNGAVTSSLPGDNGAITSTLGDSVISTTVDLNRAVQALDPDMVSGSGTTSNGVLATVQEAATLGVFSQVNGASIQQGAVAADTNSTLSLGSNRIAADVSLNDATGTLQGQINPDFSNGDAGTTGPVTLDAAAATTLFTALEAGLLVGSAQITRAIDTVTAGNTGPFDAFSSVDGATSIATSLTGAYQQGLTVTSQENAISASFTGNVVDTLLDLRAGGASTLASSAGIASVQINDGLGTGSTRSAVIDDTSGTISATVDGGGVANFSTSTLSFTDNALSATAAGNSAENDLAIAAGISVDAADTTPANTMTLTAGSEALTTSGGLFVSSAQVSTASNIRSEIEATADNLSARVTDALTSSTVNADRNSIETSALGNEALSSITVAGASAFDASVSVANLQGFAADGAAVTVEARTTSANLLVGVGTTDAVDIAGSTVTADGNAITSRAVANADPRTIAITASDITDDGFAGIPLGSAALQGAADTASLTAGITTLSGQSATGVADGTPTTVSATTATGQIALTAGSTTAGQTNTITATSFSLAENDIAATASLNEGAASIELDAANTIDASTGAGVAQIGEFSDAAAVTSDASITASLNTAEADATNLTVVLGDGDLSDGAAGGNTISAAAAGQTATALLEVSAGNEITVTGAINSSGAVPNGLEMDVTNNNPTRTSAEMTVFSDQRLFDADISARTTAPVIAATVSPADQAITAATIAVDGNRIEASARGNQTSNRLAVTAASIDMSAADSNGPTLASSNLATLAAAQEIGQPTGTDAISAEIEAGAGTEILARVAGTTGTVADSSISVDANSVTAFAAGNTASNILEGSGTALETDGRAGTRAGLLPGVPGATASDLEIIGVAIISGTVQANAAPVSAAVATTAADLAIAVDLAGSGAISNTAVSVDTNRVLAQARGLSAITRTSLDYSVIESSATNAVQQLQSGAVSAAIGGAGSVTLSATADDGTQGTAQDLVASVLSVSANTLGAELFGAVADSSLTVAAANRLEGGTEPAGIIRFEDGNAGSGSGDFDLTAAGQFLALTQQTVTGSVTGSADDLSVSVAAVDMGGGVLAADANLLTSQATGATLSSALALSGSDLGTAVDAVRIGGGVQDVAEAGLLSVQRFGAGGASDLTASLTASDITVSASDLGSVGTNASETLSADDNILSALGTGLRGANTLTAAAVSGQGGLAAPSADIDVNGADGGSVLAFVEADQALLVDQAVTGGIDVDMTTNAVRVQQNGPAGTAVDGDTLSVAGNAFLAEGTGAANASVLTSSAGTGSAASSIVSTNQATAAAGAVDVANTVSSAQLTASGTVDASTLTLGANRLAATATGLSGSNMLTAAADGALVGQATGAVDIDGVANDLETTFDIGVLSNQSVGAAVSAGLTTASLALDVTGAVGSSTGATLRADANRLAATATGATDANNVTVSGGTALSELETAIAASQDSVATVTADLTSGGATSAIALTAGSTVASSTLSLSENALAARATVLSSANALTAAAGTAATGTAGQTDEASATIRLANRGTGGILLDADANRIVATDQLVSAGGAVASMDGTPTLRLDAVGAVTGSTLRLADNALAAEAVTVSVNNRLANSAGTALGSAATVAAIQESAGGATATLATPTLALFVGDRAGPTPADVASSSVALSANTLTAAATGLEATNSLDSAGASIAGGSAESVDIDYAAGGASVLANVGFSQLTSVQEQTGAVAARFGEIATASAALTLDAGAVDGTSVALDDNRLNARATGAEASNRLTQSASGAVADGSGATLAALQDLAGTVEASMTGLTLGSTVGAVGASQSSVATVDGNEVLAGATGATLSNALTVRAGTSLTGDDESNIALGFNGGPDLDTRGDADLGSVQVSAATVTATIAGGSDGNEFPRASLTTGQVGIAGTPSTVSTSENRFRSLATNLVASNSVSVGAGTTVADVNTALVAAQNVTASTEGRIEGASAALGTGGAALFGTASVDRNVLVAAGTGAVVTNRLDATAAEMSTTLATAGDLANTLEVYLEGEGLQTAAYNSSTDDPGLAIATIQTREAGVTAVLADGDTGSVNGNPGISAATGAVTGTLSVKDNILLSQARGLQASNAVSLSVENAISGSSAAIGNIQDGEEGAVLASVNPGDPTNSAAAVSLSAGGAVSGTLALDGNAVQSLALANSATNALSVTAGNGVATGPADTNASATATATRITGRDIGFAVTSAQRNDDTVTASVENTSTTAAVTGTVDGTITVDRNSVVSDARSNVADNRVRVDAANAVSSTAALVNTQESTANAALTARVNQTPGTDSGSTILTASGQVTGLAAVRGTVVQANAVQNQAVNSMVLNADTLASANGGSVNTGGTFAATADYVALNRQTNSAAASGSVVDYTIGIIAADGTTPGLAGGLTGTAVVDDNMILASAAGNTAATSLAFDAAGNARGDVAVAGSQVNDGGVAARIENATVALGSAIGGAGSFGASRNRIGATAQGNVASTSLGTGRSAFSNF